MVKSKLWSEVKFLVKGSITSPHNSSWIRVVVHNCLLDWMSKTYKLIARAIEQWVPSEHKRTNMSNIKQLKCKQWWVRVRESSNPKHKRFIFRFKQLALRHRLNEGFPLTLQELNNKDPTRPRRLNSNLNPQHKKRVQRRRRRKLQPLDDHKITNSLNYNFL